MILTTNKKIQSKIHVLSLWLERDVQQMHAQL